MSVIRGKKVITSTSVSMRACFSSSLSASLLRIEIRSRSYIRLTALSYSEKKSKLYIKIYTRKVKSEVRKLFKSGNKALNATQIQKASKTAKSNAHLQLSSFFYVGANTTPVMDPVLFLRSRVLLKGNRGTVLHAL